MRRFATLLALAVTAALITDDGWRPSAIVAQPPGDRFDGPPDRDPGSPPDPQRGRRDRSRFREQGPGGGPPGSFRGLRPHGLHPLIAVLDVDDDGAISAVEIEGAVAALKKLDKNGDGQITHEELRPDRGRPPENEFDRRNRRGRGDRPDRRGTPEDGLRRGPEHGFGRGPDGDPGRGPEHGFGRGPDGNAARGDRPSPEQIVELIFRQDTDGNGRIAKDEASDRLQRRFDRIDTDGNGFLDKWEIEKAAKRMGRRGRLPRGDRPPRGGRPNNGERPPQQRPPLDDSDV